MRAFLAVLTAILLLAIVPPAASAAGLGRSITIFSTPGDWIGMGRQQAFHDGNAAITGSASPAGGAGFGVEPHDGREWGRSFDLAFVPAANGSFGVGAYERVARWPAVDPDRHTMWIKNAWTACNTLNGSFDVKEVAYGPGGELTRLWMLYEQHCEERRPALWGEVRIGMPAEAGDAAVASRLVRWPENEIGRRFHAVPVELHAKDATAVDSVALDGPDAAGVEIVQDDCSGRALAAGVSCKVWVRPAPLATAGELDATLTLTEEGGAAHEVALSARARATTTEVQLLSDPDDWVGRGGSPLWRPDDWLVHADAWPDAIVFRFGALDSHSHWEAVFRAPSGEQLAPGRYAGAALPADGSPQPGLQVWGGNGCDEVTGEFTVHELRRDPFGELAAAHVTFEQHCGGARAALRGSLRFNASDGAEWMPGLVPTDPPVDDQPEGIPSAGVTPPVAPPPIGDPPPRRDPLPHVSPPSTPGPAPGGSPSAPPSLARVRLVRERLTFVAGEAGRLRVRVVRTTAGTWSRGRCRAGAPRRTAAVRRCKRTVTLARATHAVPAGRGSVPLPRTGAASARGSLRVVVSLVALGGRNSRALSVAARPAAATR